MKYIKKQHFSLEEVLANFGWALLDRNDFNLSEEESRKTCTRKCIVLAQEKGFLLCDRHTTITFVAICKTIFRQLGWIRGLFVTLPRYVVVVERLEKNYYACSTIYFKRKFLFLITITADHSEVFGSYLFDRKLVFNLPRP